MKRLLPVVVTAIGLSICLIAPARADITQGLPTENEADGATLFCSEVGAFGTPAPQTQEDLYNQGLVKSQIGGQGQPKEQPSDRLAQPMGQTCITPAGTCNLDYPAPINSSCCCNEIRSCGYVSR